MDITFIAVPNAVECAGKDACPTKIRMEMTRLIVETNTTRLQANIDLRPICQ